MENLFSTPVTETRVLLHGAEGIELRKLTYSGMSY